MAVLLIRNINVVTSAGWPASIDGIDPTDDDFLVGTVHAPTGVLNAQWDDKGVCRGSVPGANLNVGDDAVADAIETAKPLRALFP